MAWETNAVGEEVRAGAVPKISSKLLLWVRLTMDSTLGESSSTYQ